MTSNVEHNGNENINRPASGLWKKILIGGAVAAGLGGWWYQTSQVASVRNDLAQTQQKMEQLQGQMQTSVALAKSEVQSEMNETVSKMNGQVESARREALVGSHRAQAQAGHVLTTLSAKNVELAQQVDQNKKENDQKATELDQTLTGIKGDVGNVKTDVVNTQTELTQTSSDLKRATGDMGVMSGLIATNSTQLSALKELGESDYFEFTLPRNGAAQRVGGISLTLKRTDVKRNRFTLDVLADDKRVEKRDKSINEPVQFYTSKSRKPYEVVVNEIRKDQVIGYLAVPKVKIVASR